MNNDTVAGKFDEIKGKVKEAVGEAVGNQRLANSGAADQVKGNAKETWGNVKDAASDASSDTRRTTATDVDAHARAAGHDTRESVTSSAQNMKDKISDKLDDLKR